MALRWNATERLPREGRIGTVNIHRMAPRRNDATGDCREGEPAWTREHLYRTGSSSTVPYRGLFSATEGLQATYAVGLQAVSGAAPIPRERLAAA